jgi:hypothetical protein
MYYIVRKSELLKILDICPIYQNNIHNHKKKQFNLHLKL